MSVAPLRPLLLALALVLAAPSGAQSHGEAEKKLQNVRGELKAIARERRKLEGERSAASRQLREADEQVGRSSRSLGETEAALQREQAALAELQQRRQHMREGLDAQRRQLSALVRAAYVQGSDAPLQVLLAQDRVADAQRTLAYHRYLQGDRAQRIAALTGELQQLASLEKQIQARRSALEATRAQQQARVAQLQRDRRQRAGLVAELDERYQDRSAREKALGQDARALERLLDNLRAAARRTEAERRAADKRAEAERSASSGAPPKGKGSTPRASTPRATVASAPTLKVGGLGWPLSGSLLARFGGKLPDGRASAGVLIGAPAGSTVTAVADGSVVFAEWMTGYGLILIVDHGNGYMSLYAHNDSLLREPGDRVKRGEPVARVGSSGGQGEPALYFELRRNGQPVDPASWLQRK